MARPVEVADVFEANRAARLFDGRCAPRAQTVAVAVARVLMNVPLAVRAGDDLEGERRARHLARVLDDGLRRDDRARACEEREARERRVNLGGGAALVSRARPPVNPRVALGEIDRTLRVALCQHRRDEQVVA